MRFTLRQLNYFRALTQSRHFGRAAEAVHVSQPALSAQIAELEAQIGGALFERARSGVTLTPLGRRLAPQMLEVLAEAEGLDAQIDIDRQALEGDLALGIIPTIAPYLFPQIVMRLREAYPRTALRLRESTTDVLIGELLAGELDAVIAAAPIDETGLVSESLFRDEFLLVMSTNDADFLTAPLIQDQIALDRLLLLEEGHCLRDQALTVCQAHRPARQTVNVGATSLTTLLQMVAQGMGYTLVPQLAIPHEVQGREDMRLLAFSEPAPARDIALFMRATSPLLADRGALAALIREARAGDGSQ
ncbi:MAG: LysR substrate-binding domain-containing protein [Pseudomonadota bacterium]